MTASRSVRTIAYASSTHDDSPRRRSTALQLLRHYAEMVVVMVLGMVVLGIPVDAALRAAGSSSGEVTSEAPALMLLGMAFSMTAPMVAWMRFRGHSRRASIEMSATMVVPTLAAIAVHASGLVEDIDVVVVAEHGVMLVAMLVAMLLRPSEYTHARTAAA